MSRIMRLGVICLVLVGLSAAVAFSQENSEDRFARWKPHMEAFAKADAQSPPEPGQVLFVGSSSIVRWDLKKWLPEVAALNRGFGGSQIPDSVHYFDNVVTPYKPRLVVFYAGDNDIARGRTPDQAHADFQAFAGKLRETFPETPLIYIAIKPSIQRWKQVHLMREANARIKADCEKDPLLTFLDVDAPMLGEDGQPREELFVKDGLHLSDEGYKLWSALLLPHLLK